MEQIYTDHTNISWEIRSPEIYLSMHNQTAYGVQNILSTSLQVSTGHSLSNRASGALIVLTSWKAESSEGARAQGMGLLIQLR